MADNGLDRLGADHLSWLHVAADNFLRQRFPDRATALLEFACLVAPDDPQSRKMLAYAYWLQGDQERCAGAIAQVLDQPLSAADRSVVKALQRRLAGAPTLGARA